MDNQKKPLITVVTVCYNAVNELEKTMLSVLNQTYDNIEYIVIDGGSKDGTVDIIKKYADRLAYWVSEPDKGIYDAMNKGVKAATGEWINFMNAGDFFVDENVISNMFNQSIDTSVGFVFGDTIFAYKTYNELFSYREKKNNIYSQVMPACHQSIFCKTIYIKQSLFDLKYRIAADFNFFYCLWKKHIPYQYKNVTVAVYEASDGLSSRNTIRTKREIMQILYNPFVFRTRFAFYRLLYPIVRIVRK